MNKVMLMGRLTADPELKNSQSGVASCRFTVAVDRGYINKQGERESDFIGCVAFRSTAEFISKYFRKGKMILIEGSLRNNNYQDRTHSDVMHYSYEVFADKAEFCGDKKAEQAQPNGSYQNPPPPNGSYQNQPPPNGNYQNPPPPNGYYQNPPPPNGNYQNQPPPGYQDYRF